MKDIVDDLFKIMKEFDLFSKQRTEEGSCKVVQ